MTNEIRMENGFLLFSGDTIKTRGAWNVNDYEDNQELTRVECQNSFDFNYMGDSRVVRAYRSQVSPDGKMLTCYYRLPVSTPNNFNVNTLDQYNAFLRQYPINFNLNVGKNRAIYEKLKLFNLSMKTFAINDNQITSHIKCKKVYICEM